MCDQTRFDGQEKDITCQRQQNNDDGTDINQPIQAVPTFFPRCKSLNNDTVVAGFWVIHLTCIEQRPYIG